MSSHLALITFVGGGGPVDPGFGVSAPVYPSQGLPGFGGGRPDNSLPPFAVQLPVFPFDPTRPSNELPGSQPGVDNSLPSGRPSRPDNSLPSSGARPDQGLPVPGKRYVVKWVACHGLILVPDNSLPGSGASIDNELPETPEPK